MSTESKWKQLTVGEMIAKLEKLREKIGGDALVFHEEFGQPTESAYVREYVETGNIQGVLISTH